MSRPEPDCAPRPAVPARPSASPLAQTLAAARERFGGHDVLATRIGAPAGWLAAPDLMAPGPALRQMLARTTASTGGGRADIGGTWLVESYAWALAMRGVGALLLGDRVPAMAAAEVRLRLVEPDDAIAEVAFAGGAYGVDGDECQDDPALVTLPDHHALAARLRDELEAHLRPLLDAVATEAGRSRRALWRSAGDRLGGAFMWLGEVLGERERAWALGTPCMRGSGPLAVGARFRMIEHAGGLEPTWDRRSCCLAYRCEGHETCLTCPLTTEAQRRARLDARSLAQHP